LGGAPDISARDFSLDCAVLVAKPVLMASFPVMSLKLSFFFSFLTRYTNDHIFTDIYIYIYIYIHIYIYIYIYIYVISH